MHKSNSMDCDNRIKWRVIMADYEPATAPPRAATKNLEGSGNSRQRPSDHSSKPSFPARTVEVLPQTELTVEQEILRAEQDLHFRKWRAKDNVKGMPAAYEDMLRTLAWLGISVFFLLVLGVVYNVRARHNSLRVSGILPGHVMQHPSSAQTTVLNPNLSK